MKQDPRAQHAPDNKIEVDATAEGLLPVANSVLFQIRLITESAPHRIPGELHWGYPPLCVHHPPREHLTP